jgi:HSP20 family protein
MNLQGDVWPWQLTERRGMTIPLDVCESANEFIVRTLVPGVTPDSLNISANENTLTVTGEFAAPDWLRQASSGGQSTGAGQQQTCWIQECPIGKFVRTVTLPFPIDPSKGQSTFVDGVLTLHLPKSQAAMTKNIPVQTGSQAGNRGTTYGTR